MGTYEDTCTALGICLAGNIPVVLWGPPGQGKTSVVEDLARQQGLRLETVIASIREPSDFAGLPVVHAGTGAVTLAPPRWARELAATDRGLVFFDELSTAPPSVQAAMLRVVLDRVVGDLELPASTRIVAAANPPGEAADGWDLAPPMANRFCHLTWKLSAHVLVEGFTFGWAPVPVPRLEEAELEQAVASSRRLIASFLSSRPHLVTMMPTERSATGFAFPTPRSWDMAARLHAACRLTGSPDDVRTLLLTGCVGEAAAAELSAYLDTTDLPSPAALLADPDSHDFTQDRADVVQAIGASVWALSSAFPDDSGRWNACGRVLARITDAGHADVAYSIARRWIKTRPSGAVPHPTTMATLAPILREFQLMPAAAGSGPVTDSAIAQETAQDITYGITQDTAPDPAR